MEMLATTKKVEWKIHCASPVHKLFYLLNSNEGRKSFWAESAEEKDGCVQFIFPNGQTYTGRIVDRTRDASFSLIYFDTLVTFHLSGTEEGGTVITLVHDNIPSGDYDEVKAGWVSILLSLKAFADFGVDIRNHHKDRTWDNNFADN